MPTPQRIEDPARSQSRPSAQRFLSSEHDVSTTQAEGWSDVLKGELLRLLEEHGFEVMLTADSNIRSQQNFSSRNIAVVVLRAYNNRLATHVQMIDEIEAALLSIRKGEIVEVFHRDLRK